MKPEQDKQVNTTADLDAILAQISFKNSVLDFQWRYQHKPFYEAGGVVAGWLLWVEFLRPDIISGSWGWGRGREEIFRKGGWESGLVKTAYVLYRFIVEHEMMEGFRYQGVRIFNPHHTVHELSLPAIIARANNVDMDEQKDLRNSVQGVGTQPQIACLACGKAHPTATCMSV